MEHNYSLNPLGKGMKDYEEMVKILIVMERVIAHSIKRWKTTVEKMGYVSHSRKK